MDILLFGTPKSWQKEMDRQGYDPLENTDWGKRPPATNFYKSIALPLNYSTLCVTVHLALELQHTLCNCMSSGH